MSAADAGAVTAAAVTAWLRVYAAEVAVRRDELTALDAAIGDADHGVNMDRGMQAVAAKLGGGGGEQDAGGPGEASLGALGPLFKTVGMTLVSTVGGAAGPLYGTLFLEMGKAAGERTGLSPHEWAEVLSAGVAGVRMRGKAEPGDKTMVDALLPAAEALRTAAGSGASLAEALRAAAGAAEAGMVATTPLVARKGRASYLGERSAGHQDPGATSSWLLLETAAATLAGGETARQARRPARRRWAAETGGRFAARPTRCSRGRPRSRQPQREARRGRHGAGRPDGRAGGADRRRRRPDRTGGALGTDATRVLEAIEAVWSEDGVLVLMDLGSAVLSAELAVDLLEEERRRRVLLTEAPLVEGAVAAAVAAALGDPLEKVAAAARGGLDGKASHLAPRAPSTSAAAEAAHVTGAPDASREAPSEVLRITVRNRLGLHARPAARWCAPRRGSTPRSPSPTPPPGADR